MSDSTSIMNGDTEHNHAACKAKTGGSGSTNPYAFPPKVFHRGQKINEHAERVQEYCDTIDCRDKKLRSRILFHSLEESVQYELKSYSKFNDVKDDFDNLKEALFEIFQCRSSKLNDLQTLFKVKQENQQTARDFISSVRIKCVKTLHPDTMNTNGEKYMLAAFLNGLRNRDMANALKQLEVKTIEECYEYVKDLEDQQKPGDELICATRFEKKRDDDIRQLREEVKRLTSL